MAPQHLSERLAPFAAAPRLVVKLGSSLLVGADGQPRRDWLAGAVADFAAHRAAGRALVVVSSGAIALGARRLGLPKGGRASLEDAQAAAAAGQIALAALWSELWAAHGVVAAQLLLTLGDLEDRRRYLNAAATLDRLLTLGAVPVVNENDTVATEEIRFGDNDRLAARVAQAAGAGAVLLLSDVDGLYTADPHGDPAARRIGTVTDLAAIAGMADGRSASGVGSGGMAAKVEAARIALVSGVHLAVAPGAPAAPLSAFLGDGASTVFLASSATPARKAWLAGRQRVAGRIEVDAGAAAALRAGASLLAAGVTAVTGDFARGDLVEVSSHGAALARGLSAYTAVDVARLKGLRGDAHGAVLGYAPRSAIIHRDQLVLLP